MNRQRFLQALQGRERLVGQLDTLGQGELRCRVLPERLHLMINCVLTKWSSTHNTITRNTSSHLQPVEHGATAEPAEGELWDVLMAAVKVMTSSSPCSV